ncbi:O-antigen ligase [Duganella sp. 3397]|uniref:O-antigen ligase family protein n=1 Tax=Duganella sp. 3397 TaxID=2817732 RepID=UPI00285462B3|nr:O-antigen ligase family protein [Duganella sp. 3397]MDR7052099.1 O-antigen ligase [Duganella sp. 3397]
MPALLKSPAWRSLKAPDFIKNPFRLIYVMVVLAVCLAGLLGAATPILVELMDGSLSKLVALPAAMVFGLLVIYDRKLTLLLIVVLRAGGDNALEFTRFSLGGYMVGIGGVINGIVILLALLLVFERPKVLPGRAYMAWAPFLVILALGAVHSPFTGESVRLFLQQLSYFAMFVGGYQCVADRADFRRMLRLVVWSSAIPVLYAFVDIALHFGGGFRLESTFAHPNVLAFYLTVIIVVAFYLLKTMDPGASGAARLGLVAYVLLLLLMLLLTKTRSAWLATAIGFALYALIFERRFLVYMVLLGVGALFVPGIGDRLLDLGQGNEVATYATLNSFAWRVYLWECAFAWMSPLHYVWGLGLQTFAEYSPIFFPLAGKTKFGAHSVFVQLIFELGVIGLLAFLWQSASLIRQLARLLKFDKLAAFSLILIILSFLICSFSDNMFYYLSYNWYLWFVVGAGCALARVLAATPSKVTASTVPPPMTAPYQSAVQPRY